MAGRGATAEATAAFETRSLKSGAVAEHFRDVRGWRLSSIGMGTYLGEHDDETDALYVSAARAAAKLGCNFFDCAINYRCQRSERAIGAALRRLEQEGSPREQFVIATKGGYIPFDGEPPGDVTAYLRETFIEPGILKPDDIVGGHALAPDFLRHQIEASLSNLGLDSIDVYYLHNPEAQLARVEPPVLMRRLRDAFELLEAQVEEGRIAYYGTATWSGYRVPPSAKEFLSLRAVEALAREVAGEKHHFRFVQAPYNLGMPEALTERNQDESSLAQAVSRHDLHWVTSASLAQGQLAQGLPDWLGTLFRGLDTQAQLALQFARSTPGVTSALVGMKSPEHVRENLACARVAPASAEDVLKLFEVDSGSS